MYAYNDFNWILRIDYYDYKNYINKKNTALKAFYRNYIYLSPNCRIYLQDFKTINDVILEYRKTA